MVDARFRELVDAYLDDHLDAATAQEFDTRLRVDAEARTWFAAQCRREMAIRAVLQVQQQAGTVATARVRRIRRRRLHALPRAWGWAVAAGLLALLTMAVVVVSLRPARSVETPVAVRHDAIPEVVVEAAVNANRPETPGRAVRSGDELAIGHALVVGTSASLRFGNNRAHLHLGAHSRARVDGDGLRLDAGHVTADVTPAQGRIFTITTPHARVRVVGTSFAVTVSDERNMVVVAEGIVEVLSAAPTRRLTAGESGTWPVPAEDPVVIPPAAELPAAEPPERQGVTSLVLLDGLSGNPVPGYEPLRDGMDVDQAALSGHHVGLLAVTVGGIVSVRFTVDGPTTATRVNDPEVVVPFIYPGDTPEGIYPTWSLSPGVYRITAQGFRDAAATAPAGARCELSFTVIDRR